LAAADAGHTSAMTELARLRKLAGDQQDDALLRCWLTAEGQIETPWWKPFQRSASEGAYAGKHQLRP
jgi:hypothetical protein